MSSNGRRPSPRRRECDARHIVVAPSGAQNPSSVTTDPSQAIGTFAIMPLTIPTHPVAVVPLKLWRPTWFDGVALVIGSIAPDVSYAFLGYGFVMPSHAWHGPLWWGLPVTLIGAWLARRAAPAIAAHLPSGGPLALRDYGVLGSVRHPWYVTWWSALVGAYSHLAWDSFTHATIDGHHPLLPVLLRQVPPGVPLWYVFSTGSNLFGFVMATALIVHIGRNRLLRRWHGPAPRTVRRPALFWAAVVGVVGAGLVWLWLQPVHFLLVKALQAMLIGGLALLAGAAAVARRPAHQ
jgi:hypothetical protein